MRKAPALLGVFLIVLWAVNLLAAQDHRKPMTNDDVVELVKAGLPDETIVNAIHAQDTQFDSSAPALVTLKQKGVSPTVLDAMLKASAPPRDVPTPATASGPAANAGAAPPPSGPAKPTAAVNPNASAAGSPESGASAPAKSSGFFGRLQKFQSQIGSSAQQAQSAVQQSEATVQQTRSAAVQQKDAAAQSLRGVESGAAPASGAPAVAAPATPSPASAQVPALQPQRALADRGTPTQQQQLAARQARAKKLAACRKQAAAADPQGGADLAKAYVACTQAR